MSNVKGLHHITAIAGDAQENLDFYVGTLGMRLVKRTVNQDAPDTYHLFYGDRDGNPGIDLTFFPWPKLPARRRGWGVWDEVMLGVPKGALDYWVDRLNAHGVSHSAVETRFGERVLPYQDPHGLCSALVESEPYEGFTHSAWPDSSVPEECQIHSLAGIRIFVRDESATADFMARAFGFRLESAERQHTELEELDWKRYVLGDGKAGQRIELSVRPEIARGSWGTGAIHHVAWRAGDEAEQAEFASSAASAGAQPTPVIDRFWFKSVYMQEPSGALNEIATDGPGFAVDEEPAALGERLVLPPKFENHRDAIEAGLPPISVSQALRA